MFRSWGKSSLSAHRYRFAGGGLASASWLLAALLLSACQAPQHSVQAQTAANPIAPAQPQSSQPDPAQSQSADAPLPKQTPLATTPAVAHGDAIMPAAIRLTGDPKELLGLDHAALRRVLGRPAQVRHEVSAQVWQYVTGDCVVDLYLYNDDSGALKVTYVEARSRSAEQTPTSRCLKSLLERPTASAQ
jgi:hypothetical protein